MFKTKKVFVMMSGGVDSSVAAALLKERGFSVVGVYMRCWDVDGPSARLGVNCNERDAQDARRVAEKLGIPFYVFDFEKEYRKAVVDYMIFEYAAGRTPNPDVMCNREIKFGIFLKRALELGADYVATGHYVRLGRTTIGNKQLTIDKIRNNSSQMSNVRCQMFAAGDQNKDQSYFLWTLTQEQLKHCLFPIGDYTKPEVRELARKFGLPTAEKEESQGICFIGEVKLREFLAEYIPEKRGEVVTSFGRVIGEHSGVSFYTIGQRQGLAIGGGIPYYVAQKEVSTNTLVVAEGPYDPALYQSEAVVGEINWIAGRMLQLPFRCQARIRYRQPLQEATIESRITNQESRGDDSIIRNSKFLIRFKEQQRAVTPGQSLVFYQEDPFDPAQGREAIGGGVIA